MPQDSHQRISAPSRQGRRMIWLPLALLLPVSACSGGEGGDRGKGSRTEGAGTRLVLQLDATYPEPFSFLSGVRAMPDGTLLAADPLGQVLLRLDMESATADTLGRVGEGPEEYEQPDRVFPLPADSTLLVDLGNNRLTTLDPRGRFVESMPLTSPSDDGMPTVLLPRFLDAQGHLYFTGTRGMDADPPDSTYVLRYDRATATLDTVAPLWVPELQVERTGGRVRLVNTMLQGEDDWAVAPHGGVAVVRANGYSVDWYRPDGTVVRGPAVPHETLSPTRADKEAVLEEMTSQGLSMFMTRSSDGGTSMRMSRGGTMGRSELSVEDFQWAETLPPFRNDRTLVSPEAEVWVQRMGHASDSTEFHVFDEQGRRTGTARLAPRRRIIGFGRNGEGQDVAYVTRTDEVGLTWLERYRILR